MRNSAAVIIDTYNWWDIWPIIEYSVLSCSNKSNSAAISINTCSEAWNIGWSSCVGINICCYNSSAGRRQSKCGSIYNSIYTCRSFGNIRNPVSALLFAALNSAPVAVICKVSNCTKIWPIGAWFRCEVVHDFFNAASGLCPYTCHFVCLPVYCNFRVNFRISSCLYIKLCPCGGCTEISKCNSVES